MDYKDSWVVVSIKVPIDLDIILWVNNISKFYRFWNLTLSQYEKYFAEYTISIYIQDINYKKTYLLDNYQEIKDRKMYENICDGTYYKINKFDYELLNELALNARIPSTELADKLNCSSQNVSYHIKNLLKNDIIKGFRINLDYQKIGFQIFKLDIFLKQFKERESIIKYLEKQPYFIILNVAVGWADIEPEIVVKNVEILLETIEELNKRFPNIIKKQVFWIKNKNYKEKWLPEMEFK
jgi:Lrp/AsnC family leucine-responsive transcriptional regulator